MHHCTWKLLQDFLFCTCFVHYITVIICRFFNFFNPISKLIIGTQESNHGFKTMDGISFVHYACLLLCFLDLQWGVGIEVSWLMTKFAIHEPLLVLTYVKLEVCFNLTGVWASNFFIFLMFHDWNVLRFSQASIASSHPLESYIWHLLFYMFRKVFIIMNLASNFFLCFKKFASS